MSAVKKSKPPRHSLVLDEIATPPDLFETVGDWPIGSGTRENAKRAKPFVQFANAARTTAKCGK